MKKYVWALVCCAGMISCAEEPVKHKWPIYGSDIDGSVVQVKDYLQKSLPDPSSYESVEWSPLAPDDTTHPHNYMVRHKFRAKDVSGTLQIKNVVFYLDSAGNVTGEQNY